MVECVDLTEMEMELYAFGLEHKGWSPELWYDFTSEFYNRRCLYLRMH